MSYSISWKVKVEGFDKFVTIWDPCCNITYNVRDIIIKSTGLEWKNCADNGFVKDVMVKIANGLVELIQHKKEYRQYESSNGYGNVDDVIQFYMNLINEWDNFVDVEGDISNIARFWIE